jgi:hypothetical protein
MLHEKSLPSKFWAEAIKFSMYIKNRSPHKFVKGKTPYEAWTDMMLEVTHFVIFGSCTWAHMPSENRKDLEPQRK